MTEKTRNLIGLLIPVLVIFAGLIMIYLVTLNLLTANTNNCRDLMARLDDPNISFMCGQIFSLSSSILYFSLMSGILIIVLCSIISSKVSDSSRISSLENKLNEIKERFDAA